MGLYGVSYKKLAKIFQLTPYFNLCFSKTLQTHRCLACVLPRNEMDSGASFLGNDWFSKQQTAGLLSKGQLFDKSFIHFCKSIGEHRTNCVQDGYGLDIHVQRNSIGITGQPAPYSQGPWNTTGQINWACETTLDWGFISCGGDW